MNIFSIDWGKESLFGFSSDFNYLDSDFTCKSFWKSCDISG